MWSPSNKEDLMMELNIGDRVSRNHDHELKGTVVKVGVVCVAWDADPETDFDYLMSELTKEDA
jgi:hypothetical protein